MYTKVACTTQFSSLLWQLKLVTVSIIYMGMIKSQESHLYCNIFREQQNLTQRTSALVIYRKASFTRQRFSQKQHRFIVVFNVRLHGDSENDHKNANGLQSEAFQKRTENDLRVIPKKNTGKRCS